MPTNGKIGSWVRRVLVPLLLALILGGCVADRPEPVNPAAGCLDRQWPWAASDLSVDPALRFGRLDNGLRYVLMGNHQPRGRVALYLDVQAGSLNEEENQRGLAHFLEHMLFNGTRHYPPGTLIDYFQSIGMSFGADTNAHTSYNETVYKLLLPAGDKKTVDEGLVVMDDWARGALLLPEEIERERGVILAEKRSRDSAAARVARRRMAVEFAGTRVASRYPIGLERVIRSADQTLFRRFYDQWYRPDNMVLILVGDTDLDQAEALIRNRLAPLAAAGPDPSCYDFGRIDEGSSEFLYLDEPDLGRTDLSLTMSWNVTPRVDTRAVEKESLREYVAALILDNRMQQLIGEPGAPLTETQVYAGVFVRRLGYFTIVGRTDGDRWRQGLSRLATAWHQILTHGVEPAELVRARQQIIADLKKKAEGAASRSSDQVAAAISRDLNNFDVTMAPAEQLAVYSRMLATMTSGDIDRVLRRIRDHSRRVVTVAGTARPGATTGHDGRDVIRRVWQQAMATPVAPWRPAARAAFPYLSPARDRAPVAKVVPHPAIGAATTVLANGIRINIRRTDFEKGLVRLAVHFGGGMASEPAPGLGRLAEAVVRESGVGRLTRQQLAEAISGHSLELRFVVGEESFSFAGQGLNTDLELMLQLIQTMLEDPAFREDAFIRVRQQFAQKYRAMEESVDGRMELVQDRFFAGGNPRYGWPDKDDFMGLTLDRVRDWLSPVLARPDLEFSLVGDLDPDQAVDLVRRYFGDLPPVTRPAVHPAPVRFPAGKKKTITVKTGVGKGMLAVGWGTADFWDIARTRRLSVLAALFADRLRKSIREQLGATYSPVVYNRSSRVDRGYGVLRCLLTVAPDMVEPVNRAVLAIAGQLSEKGVDDGELRRVLAPIMTSIRDMQRTNRYWLDSVLALSSRHPEQLDWPLTIVADFGAMTRDEINDLARTYLRPGTAALLNVVSQATENERPLSAD